MSETTGKSKTKRETSSDGLYVALISLHGLVRGHDLELGRDADTGGQVKYVVELARALAERDDIRRVDLITRQVIDERVSDDYAQVVEELGPKFAIHRIAFGPRRYLRKENLWPYMDHFVDNAIKHFRRYGGIPDVIHGHYADAGYGGAQLARLLGVPFVFTGHSLGRVKRDRIIERGGNQDELEGKYSFSSRVEAEEIALETASLVVASTRQEVEDQYERYDHYVPERMEVIPPGVDLKAFLPPDGQEAKCDVKVAIDRFLDHPEKPPILAIARPDERKNLEALVEVYGKSRELQERANLVLVLGSREDIRQMSAAQRKVMLNILTLIDTYDLYGKVAYPKSHRSEEVQLIYRLAAARRGVFVNPAWTEPFGLTLLEAAGSGLPVVATNDGGPRDILANCDNGLLVDPYDQEAIGHALITALSDEEKWDQWSENGTKGAHKHYSWARHAERYMRDVQEIVSRSPQRPSPLSGTKRRLPDFDRLLITDIDNTLTGDDEALRRLFEVVKDSSGDLGFGIASGRSFKEVLELLEELKLPRPDVLISAVGTEVHYGESLVEDRSWSQQINFQWNRKRVIEVLDDLDGFGMQDESSQSRWKVSYQIDPEVAPSFQEIKRILRGHGLRVKATLSHGIFLDIIPARAGSGLCIRHLAMKWGFPLEHILVAGDSGNDEEMLRGGTLGVVVGNYSPELEKLRNRPRIYFAEGHHANGILEGIEYYSFLGNLRIPNDRVE
jgi:sucrose-phosphate synthase